MRKTLSLFILLIAFASANSQSISLPSSVVDSIIWKLRLGRTSDSLIDAQESEIVALNLFTASQGKRITLSNTKITQLEATIKALQELSGADRDLLRTKNERLKMRLRKVWRAVVVEGAVIIVLVIVLI